MTATLYFVRHGETDWNAEARLQGRRDVPLNAVGRAQAAEVGQRLAREVADPASLDYAASPLGRTRETMEILRGAIGLPPGGYRVEQGLVELTFGSWEGLTWREVRRQDAGRAAQRERDKWGYVPPGGESYAMLRDRVAPVLALIDRPTVIVSHGGVARAMLSILAGIGTRQAPRIDIWQGRLLVVEAGGYRWV